MGNALLSSYTSPREVFWRETGIWPHDVKGYMFLGRALLEWGRRTVAGWEDDIPTRPYPEPAIGKLNAMNANSLEIGRAVALLREHSPTYRSRNPSGLVALTSYPDFPTREEWELARQISAQAHREAWERVLPYYQAIFALCDAARDGLFKTATRPVAGGQMKDQPAWFWNSERIYDWFPGCKVNAADPYARAEPEGPADWLFVEWDSFHDFLAGSGGTADVRSPEATEKAFTALRRRPGRQAKYRWAEILSELRRMLETGDYSQVSDYHLAKILADWAAENLDPAPPEDQISAKIRLWRKSGEIT